MGAAASTAISMEHNGSGVGAKSASNNGWTLPAPLALSPSSSSVAPARSTSDPARVEKHKAAPATLLPSLAGHSSASSRDSMGGVTVSGSFSPSSSPQQPQLQQTLSVRHPPFSFARGDTTPTTATATVAGRQGGVEASSLTPHAALSEDEVEALTGLRPSSLRSTKPTMREAARGGSSDKTWTTTMMPTPPSAPKRWATEHGPLRAARQADMLSIYSICSDDLADDLGEGGSLVKSLVPGAAAVSAKSRQDGANQRDDDDDTEMMTLPVVFLDSTASTAAAAMDPGDMANQSDSELNVVEAVMQMYAPHRKSLSGVLPMTTGPHSNDDDDVGTVTSGGGERPSVLRPHPPRNRDATRNSIQVANVVPDVEKDEEPPRRATRVGGDTNPNGERGRRRTISMSSYGSIVSLLALGGTEESRYQRALGSVEAAIADAEKGYERVQKASTDMIALMESWNHIAKEHFVPFAEEVFRLMIQENPDYQGLFLSSPIDQQALTTLGMVGKAVYAYTQASDILDLLTEVGARHCLYGVELCHFIAIRDSFLRVYPRYVSRSMCTRSLPAWKTFWRVTVELLMYGMTGPRAQYYLDMGKRRWICELQAFHAELTKLQRATAADAPRQHMFVVTMFDDAVARDPTMSMYALVREPLAADRSYEAIGRIIDNLDDDELVQQYVVQLGFRHFTYKLTPRVMQAFRSSFLAACEYYMHEHDLWRCVPTMRRTLAEFWEMVSSKWAVGWAEACDDHPDQDSCRLSMASLPTEHEASQSPSLALPTMPDAADGADTDDDVRSLANVDKPAEPLPTFALGNLSTASQPLGHQQQQQRQQQQKGSQSTITNVSPSLRNLARGNGSLGTSLATSSHSSPLRQLRGQATHAPQTGEPGCILFTDIEASTNLWEANPDVMRKAVRQHNILLRGLISDYGGYEVKTVGDSFMVATKDAHIALQIALGIQLELMRRPIAPGFSMAAAVSNPQGSGDPSCWRDDGLRVRIGIHYCEEASAVYDNVHRRFDYYGPSVNCAARVEAAACGGQILMTREAVEALKHTDFYTKPHSRYLADYTTCNRDPKLPLSELTKFEDIGGVMMKGIAYPIHLFSVLPIALAGRTFQPIAGQKTKGSGDNAE